MSLKNNEEIVGIPAAVIAAVAPYIEVLTAVGQLLAVWVGVAVATIALILKLKHLKDYKSNRKNQSK